MHSLLLPNLVILGPPKAGTSSLFAWITAHPQVCGARSKETFYLMDETNPLRADFSFKNGGWEGYAELFPKTALQFPVRIEATTHYLYQKTALDVLRQIPDAHVCVVLRDPAMRVWSSFRFTQNNLARVSSAIDFDQYLDFALSGDSTFPTLCTNERSAYVLDNDLRYGEYARYLERWMDQLGTDRVHWVLFEELIENPGKVVQRLTRPFGIQDLDGGSVSFEPKNTTLKVKYQGLHRIAISLNRIPFPSSLLKSALTKRYLALQEEKIRPKPNPSKKALKRLREYYAPHNRKLEELLSLNLSDWIPSE